MPLPKSRRDTDPIIRRRTDTYKRVVREQAKMRDFIEKKPQKAKAAPKPKRESNGKSRGDDSSRSRSASEGPPKVDDTHMYESSEEGGLAGNPVHSPGIMLSSTFNAEMLVQPAKPVASSRRFSVASADSSSKQEFSVQRPARAYSSSASPPHRLILDPEAHDETSGEFHGFSFCSATSAMSVEGDFVLNTPHATDTVALPAVFDDLTHTATPTRRTSLSQSSPNVRPTFADHPSTSASPGSRGVSKSRSVDRITVVSNVVSSAVSYLERRKAASIRDARRRSVSPGSNRSRRPTSDRGSVLSQHSSLRRSFADPTVNSSVRSMQASFRGRPEDLTIDTMQSSFRGRALDESTRGPPKTTSFRSRAK